MKENQVENEDQLEERSQEGDFIKTRPCGEGGDTSSTSTCRWTAARRLRPTGDVRCVGIKPATSEEVCSGFFS